MKFYKFLKDKIISICIFLFVQIFVVLILYCFKTKTECTILIFGLEFILGTSLLVYNFFRKNNFYNSLVQNLFNLDQKYYIVETLPTPTTYEEKIMVETIYEITKSMNEKLSQQKREIKDFKDFVEFWIHEVKLPIASLVLKYHNHADEVSKDFKKELRRLDDYADRILYYVRSEYAENDFSFNSVNLQKIIKNLSLKNQDDITENNIKYVVDVPEIFVSSDAKWLEFILNQILNNSIKYCKSKNATIKITATKQNKKVSLKIYDDGIGISRKDLKRVFKKSFTGENGREKIKSTGIGLYIAKNLCDKLGHQIRIASQKDEYTEVEIIFGQNDLYKV